MFDEIEMDDSVLSGGMTADVVRFVLNLWEQEEEAAAAEAKPTTEELLTAILEEIKTQKQ